MTTLTIDLSNTAVLDLSLIRGNTATLILELMDGEAGEDPFILTGSVMVLRATFRGAEKIRRTLPMPAANQVRWDVTLDESRLPPQGNALDYELERRISETQRTLLRGRIFATGNSNDD